MGRLIRLTLWALIGFIAWAGWILLRPLDPVALPYEFTVRPGQSLSSVSRDLQPQGLEQPWLMTAYGRLSGEAARIKPGIYRVEQPSSPYTLLARMAQGDSLRTKLTLIEGWNLQQVRAAIAQERYLVHDSAALSDAELARRLSGKPAASPLEGLLFPDTYVVDAGVSDLEVLRLAAEAMQNRLAAAWEKRAPNLPYRTPYEALIMASIIEKETGAGAERARIAAVFINRLRIGMPLQTDPTVIYGLGKSYDGNLRRVDLRADTPYNTYTRRGLPPTPIAMPGMAAIEAALHPAEDKALYFVGRGDGTHQFSATLAEHNRAVVQYQIRPALKQRSAR